MIQTAADETRYRGLVATGAVSKAAYDQAKAAADGARALLSAAEAQLKVAQDEGDYSTLVADADRNPACACRAQGFNRPALEGWRADRAG